MCFKKIIETHSCSFHTPAGRAPVDPAKAQVQSICTLALYELLITNREKINKTQGAFQPVIL